jgi:hypothetical protein
MEKKKLLRLSLIALLLLLIIYFAFKLFSNRSTDTNTETYSILQVKEAAQNSLSSFENWRGPTLEEWYTFYDLNKEPSAYLFNVSDYYGKAGYITISATTKLEPVVEISNLAETPVTKIIRLVNDTTIGTIYEPSDVKAEYIYLGGAPYYVKLTLREGSAVKVKYYEITEDGINEVSEEYMLGRQDYYASYKEESSEEAWENLLNSPPVDIEPQF